MKTNKGRPPKYYRWKDRDWTIYELAQHTGISDSLLYSRLHRQRLSVDQAISKPRPAAARRRVISERIEETQKTLERIEQRVQLLMERLEMLGGRLDP